MRTVLTTIGSMLTAALVLASSATAADSRLLNHGPTPYTPGEAANAPSPPWLMPTAITGVETAAAADTAAAPTHVIPPTGPACAGCQPCTSCCDLKPWQVFHCRQVEVGLLTGYARTPLVFGPQRPTMDLLPTSARIGVILNDTCSHRRLKGTFEALLEVNAIPIVSGPGNIIIGGSVLGRYNMSSRCRRLVPYSQIGFGAAYTDANRGNPTNFRAPTAFNLQSGSGFHFLVNRNWAITAESNIYLFSNFGLRAGTSTIPVGGGMVGITRFLR